MPIGDVRIARTRVQATADSGAVQQLALPSIEGQLIIPKRLFVTMQIQDSADQLVSFHHYRDVAAPTSTLSNIDADHCWWFHNFDQGECTVETDLEPYEMALIGPQAVSFWNGHAGTRNATVMMFYITRVVDPLRWASFRYSSYED